jgi:hypothetical protein
MTSHLVGFDKEMETDLKKWLWSGFKLCLGILAVASTFLLNQRLNSMGCRYAVQYTGVAGLSVLAVGKSLLNHRLTGFLLDTGYLLAVGFILVSSLQGLQSLESGGCTQYFEENTDTEITEYTVFMNETEYKQYLEEKRDKENFKHQTSEQTFNGK